jgi:hypothetical protein
MSTHKYHVTIEDCIDQDDIQRNQQLGSSEIDTDNLNGSENQSKISKRLAWVSSF